mgnify:CR=1 FL=1
MTKISCLVFNNFDYDGRAQRSAAALASIAPTTVYGPGTRTESPGRPYVVAPVALGRNKYLKLAQFWTWSLLKHLSGDVSLIYANNFHSLLPGTLLKLFKGCPLVYDAYELLAPGRRAKPIVWFHVERLLVRFADLVIVANEERARLMQRAYRLERRPTAIQNIATDLRAGLDGASEPDAPQRVDAIAAFDKKKLVYHGFISIERGIDYLLEIVSRLDEDYGLIIIGAGPDEARLSRLIEARQLQGRVLLVRPFSRRNLLPALQACHLGVCFYFKDDLNHKYCAPNKVFEYASAGIPVLMSDNIPLRKLNRKYEIGALVRMGDPETAAREVAGLFDRYAYHQGKLAGFLRHENWDGERMKLIGAVQSVFKKESG